jgi:hypothetical protein
MTFGFAMLTVGTLLLISGVRNRSIGEVLEGEFSPKAGGPGEGEVEKTPSTPLSPNAIGPPAPGTGASGENLPGGATGKKLTSFGLANGVAKATALSGRYPYVWGGGHTALGKPTNGGYDCSGAVSAVLGAMGVLSAPLTSGGLESWGQAGKGKFVTVYANEAHTFMKINGIWFGTGSDKQAIRGGPAWGNHDPDLAAYTVRHPKGG